MNAGRVIPGRPRSSTAQVAERLTALISETLKRSDLLDHSEVDAELARLEASLQLLAAGGHLSDEPLTLVAGTLRLQVRVPVGEGAVTCDADERVPSGTAGAEDWTLHVPSPEVLDPILAPLVNASSHVTCDPPPSQATNGRATAITIP